MAVEGDSFYDDDDIAELLGAMQNRQQPYRALPPQPTQEQKVAAFEEAQLRYERLEKLTGKPQAKTRLERTMVRTQAHLIDQVQMEQTSKPLRGYISPQVNVYQDVWRDIQAYEKDQAELKRKQELDAQFAAIAEVARAVGISFEEAGRALSAVFRDASDAMIAALRPLLDLLDQSESIPSQPLCPSHAIALRGGRCPRCDRGRDPHARR